VDFVHEVSSGIAVVPWEIPMTPRSSALDQLMLKLDIIGGHLIKEDIYSECL
jgi:hypothetical protein